MSAETDFYNLYRVYRNEESKLVIVKALRPDFSNHDQAQENSAWSALDKNREATVSEFCNSNVYDKYEFIAEWMDYPVGDVFYGDASGIELEVWISMHNQGKPYFAFGECETEEHFWAKLENDHSDGDCYIFPDLERPAKKQKVIYVQQKTQQTH
ncbi:hypothetical protein [Marinomonas aquiplantarum]|uniref:Uncharacterized protein n=1 Tax=Marinomonas aquiplantarum TaxID=491951 RepID=A0A366D166_9GAMM|nr:hypothetical protein [Marinomonas aquiplantarum]RBO83820.1 hypothetical protein DFP76_10394 [Marinomonas aquiplantarum]